MATALVKKYKNLLTKKVQLLLISRPRLIYVDPVKLVIAGEVPWSSQMRVKVENSFKFKIVTVSLSDFFKFVLFNISQSQEGKCHAILSNWNTIIVGTTVLRAFDLSCLHECEARNVTIRRTLPILSK